MLLSGKEGKALQLIPSRCLPGLSPLIRILVSAWQRSKKLRDVQSAGKMQGWTEAGRRVLQYCQPSQTDLGLRSSSLALTYLPLCKHPPITQMTGLLGRDVVDSRAGSVVKFQEMLVDGSRLD